MPDTPDTNNAIPLTDPSQRVPIFHPVLLALYPVMGLYAHNQDKIEPSALVRPIVVLAVGIFLLYRALRFVYNTRYKAGVATSILVVALFSGWHILMFAMGATLYYVAGMSNAVYLSAFFLVALAAVGGAVWWSRRIGLRTFRWAYFVAGYLVLVFLLAELVLARQFARGPSWYMAVFVMTTIGMLTWVNLASRPFRRMTLSLNWFGAILLGLSLLNIMYNRPAPVSFTPPTPLAEEVPAERGDKPLPDIYFLVFGGHGRADIHLDAYGYNEQFFIENMKEMGFQYVPYSAANYPNTLLSLASCLNMDYLQPMYHGTAPGVPPNEIIEFYHNNRVFDMLRRQGYKLVVTAQGSEILEPRDSVDEVIQPVRDLSEFEIVLLESSVLSPIAEWVHSLWYGSDAELRNVIERGRIYQVLDRIEELPAEESEQPRFVYTFVPIPEAPFLFDREGNWPKTILTRTYAGRFEMIGTRDEYRKAYNEQLTFTNELIEKICKRIVTDSKRPAVIIVASAHGPGSSLAAVSGETMDLRERFVNMVLLRIPDECAMAPEEPVQQLTLVNLFRTVFNRVFGSAYPLLPNEAYMLTNGPAYSFERLGTGLNTAK